MFKQDKTKEMWLPAEWEDSYNKGYQEGVVQGQDNWHKAVARAKREILEEVKSEINIMLTSNGSEVLIIKKILSFLTSKLEELK